MKSLKETEDQGVDGVKRTVTPLLLDVVVISPVDELLKNTQLVMDSPPPMEDAGRHRNFLVSNMCWKTG